MSVSSVYNSTVKYVWYILGGLLGAVALYAVVGHGLLFRSLTPIPEAPPDTFRIATYNVHYIIDRPGDGRWSLGGWEDRKEPLAVAVGALEADVIGFQEMETFGGESVAERNLALDWLLAEHPQYSAGAVGDPTEFPSTQPILFRSKRFTLRDQGWFFFSNTPDVLYSRTFNGSYPAFASWVVLEDRTTEQTFRAVNLHTDFRSYQNRKRSLALVRERVTPWVEAGETVFVLGDFNAWRGSHLHGELETVGFHFATTTAATYHFDRGLNLFPAIDHIAATPDVQFVGPSVVVQRQFAGQWPTDHYPVVADVTLSE